ncbi:t-SNARE VTI1 [Entomophthora muscae]|uniref:t-SNARE VTI1 n=1 Tax=Entomophthora muscae TaxID=34485 RepID=A0ACC2SLL5_9FUNG|nr:t-SNARE VTI1 [Entomophthora muscae]
MMRSQPGGSDLFDSYEQEFKTLAVGLEKRIHQNISRAEGEERKALVRSAERECDEGDEILAQMEAELGNLPRTSRSPLQTKLKAHQTTLAGLKRDLKKSLVQLSNASREELFGARLGVGADATQMDQRASLLSGTERLNESSSRLESSHRLALETEQLGAGILTDLRAQRDQIVNTRNTLREADAHVDTAQRTLKEMAYRMLQNRLIMTAAVILLIALILLILYFKLS